MGASLMASGTAIFNWWRRQMQTVLPWRKPAGTLLIDIQEFRSHPPSVSGRIWLRRQGRKAFIAALHPGLRLPIDTGIWPAILQLPPQMTLHRKLVLPLQAEHHLQSTVSFELDRLTPFNSGELLWSIVDLTRGRQNLRLTVAMVPRAATEPLLTVLRQMNLSPAFVETGHGRIPVQHCAPGSATWFHRSLPGLCCTLAIAVILTPIVWQQYCLDRLAAQLNALQPQQREVRLLQAQLNDLHATQAVAASIRKPDAVAVLSALTNALPRQAWLTSLSITADGLTAYGKSYDPARLIPTLAASSGILGPKLRTATAPGGNGATLFSIKASFPE